MRSRLTTVTVLVALGLVSCNRSDDGGGGDSTAGNGSGGGTSADSGGTTVGGAALVGGGSNGGSPAGGSAALGGTPNAGAPGLGGGSNGGALGLGGGSSGGAANQGGTPVFGGALNAGASGLGGGSPPLGGTTSAGAAPLGGSENGGTPNPGGASSGGAPGNGGTGVGGEGPAGAPGVGGGAAGSPIVPEPTLIVSGLDAYWQETEPTVVDGNPTVTVDENSTHQEWLGFCGTFNEAGWDALSVLSELDRAQALHLLFDGTEGIGFDWGRIPIGASDYAMDRYTLNDTPDDYEQTNFSIERDRQMLIPYIQAALAINPNVKLWGSPWSPPAWMKDSNNIDGTDAPPSGGNGTFTSHMRSEANVQQAFAIYLAKFVEEYAKEGLVIQHVQPQNEPGYSTRYPSCLWDATLMANFVGEHLGPTFTQRGVGAEIWFGTLSAPEDTAHMDAVRNNATAFTYVKGFGLQWNTMSSVSTLANTGRYVMQSEHKCGNYPWVAAEWNPDFPPNDHDYAVESWELIRDWIQAGVHMYSAWNMVLDTQGKNIDLQRPWPQNALLTVDRQNRQLKPTPAYYVFRHVSEYVDPGATRIDTSISDAVAFKNQDGSIVTIIHNSGNSPSQTTLQVGSTKLQFTIPGLGWATVNLQPGGVQPL